MCPNEKSTYQPRGPQHLPAKSKDASKTGDWHFTTWYKVPSNMSKGWLRVYRWHCRAHLAIARTSTPTPDSESMSIISAMTELMVSLGTLCYTGPVFTVHRMWQMLWKQQCTDSAQAADSAGPMAPRIGETGWNVPPKHEQIPLSHEEGCIRQLGPILCKVCRQRWTHAGMDYGYKGHRHGHIYFLSVQWTFLLWWICLRPRQDSRENILFAAHPYLLLIYQKRKEKPFECTVSSKQLARSYQ